MKRFYQIIAIIFTLIFVLSYACISPGAATVFESDGFYYARTSSTTADLYGRSATDADLVIPKDFSEYYVTNIVDSAFSGDENIETLSFGKSMLLERIGYYAFKNCIHLTGPVTFAGRISTIGTSAFENCSSLEKVVFNAYVADIPDQCFYNCSSLSTVVMNDRIQSIGKFAFANTALKEITIPDSVTSIDPTAFDGCEDLVIYCNSGSYAHEFAEENQITHVLLDTDNGYYLGDVDNNRAVEILDITFIQRSLANMTIPDDYNIEHGDIDGDNQITSTDNAIMMRSLAGLITDFPVGEWVVQHEIHQY
ncbi:leucine-rich repeat protein [uncultured Ruminococcus sp.]|uniref:leucine-rich repeat protein n=1 Tax=uncultured Ruminococcus sp. TaxID=165186 RepID=UPI0029313B94|nr:leucine-rich repeat protein [uncultured Ruminococcus sp.]